jgi:hypothetical protein
MGSDRWAYGSSRGMETGISEGAALAAYVDFRVGGIT